MSKQSKRPTRAARHQPSTKRSAPGRKLLYGGVAAAAAVALVAASFLIGGGGTSAVKAPEVGDGHGYGVGVGSKAPQFTARDVVSGKLVSSTQLAGKDVLYYFSQGVGCQSCMAQIQAFEQQASLLARSHLTLVSITNDDPGILAETAGGYGIRTPLLADPGKTLTQRFGAIVTGMHGTGADHMFILVDRTGHIRFQKDYPSMWIAPAALLKELPHVA